jgi:hypothetical protein
MLFINIEDLLPFVELIMLFDDYFKVISYVWKIYYHFNTYHDGKN